MYIKCTPSSRAKQAHVAGLHRNPNPATVAVRVPCKALADLCGIRGRHRGRTEHDFFHAAVVALHAVVHSRNAHHAMADVDHHLQQPTVPDMHSVFHVQNQATSPSKNSSRICKNPVAANGSGCCGCCGIATTAAHLTTDGALASSAAPAHEQLLQPIWP